jgi:hypothetical protein
MLAEPDQSAEDRLQALHAQAAHVRAALEKRHVVEAKQARERLRHILYALVGCILLAASLGIGMQQGWLSKAAKPRDPALDDFAQTRTGQIRTPIKGDTCREITFDNDSGRLAGGNAVPCQPASEEGQRMIGTGDRINAIRDSFRR